MATLLNQVILNEHFQDIKQKGPVLTRSKRRRGPPSPGYVYVLSNSEMPGVVKVGRTALDPAKRARELRTTGVPGRFKVSYSTWTSDAARSEATAHKLLAGKRVAKDREFFRVGERRAAQVVARACGRRRMPGVAWLAVVVLSALGAWTWTQGWTGSHQAMLRLLNNTRFLWTS